MVDNINSERKLATIRRIASLDPIANADKIMRATVDGWQVVTAKDNNFKVGDLVVYIEIDSWVPQVVAPFLSKEKEPREFNGVKGERLKTIRLRGCISQGLILPLTVLGNGSNVREGDDVTAFLNIQKWEKPVPARLAGIACGNFPSFIPKTDQERIQNMVCEFEKYQNEQLTFEVTEKLEGSSMTVYHRNNNGEIETGVCSRNFNLKETDDNAFWKTARNYQLIEKLIAMGRSIALQGELIGPGVQGNIYGLTELQFHIFDVFDIERATYLTADERAKICQEMNIKHVPFLDRVDIKNFVDITAVLEYAEGKSKLANVEREGVVFKCINDPTIHFKAISNQYLMSEKD
jgi:RNA ligase (TIGR02306 family)